MKRTTHAVLVREEARHYAQGRNLVRVRSCHPAYVQAMHRQLLADGWRQVSWLRWRAGKVWNWLTWPGRVNDTLVAVEAPKESNPAGPSSGALTR